MREAIERVIGELTTELSICEMVLESDSYDEGAKAAKYAYIDAITKLKAVIAKHETGDTGNAADNERNCGTE